MNWPDSSRSRLRGFFTPYWQLGDFGGLLRAILRLFSRRENAKAGCSRVRAGAAALTTTAVFGCGDSPASAMVEELKLRHDLKQAGYRFYSVENTAKLDSAWTTGQIDLVLADVSDAEGLE